MDKKQSISFVLFPIAISVLLIMVINKENKISSLERIINQQKKTISEYENGAIRRISQIRKAYQNNDLDQVAKLTKILSSYHPGSIEAIEAQGYIKELEKRKDEEEKRIAAEREKKKQEKEKSQRDKARSIIRVSRVYPSKPNSAGGVDAHVVWQNTSNKTIKYVSFELEPYNAVGDVVECTIRGRSASRGRVTGPIKPGQWYGENRYWECAWYNSTICKVKLISVEIEYMDGSTKELSGKDLEYIKY